MISRLFSSAHYFWYIIQTACHAFRYDIFSTNQSTISDFILLFINSNMIAKRIYRLTITTLTISYVIYYSMVDSWSMFIIPAGEVPLILMWSLNISHLVGLLGFVVFSFSNSSRWKFSPPEANVIQRKYLTNQTWRLIMSILVIQVS